MGTRKFHLLRLGSGGLTLAQNDSQGLIFSFALSQSSSSRRTQSHPQLDERRLLIFGRFALCKPAPPAARFDDRLPALFQEDSQNLDNAKRRGKDLEVTFTFFLFLFFLESLSSLSRAPLSQPSSWWIHWLEERNLQKEYWSLLDSLLSVWWQVSDPSLKGWLERMRNQIYDSSFRLFTLIWGSSYRYDQSSPKSKRQMMWWSGRKKKKRVWVLFFFLIELLIKSAKRANLGPLPCSFTKLCPIWKQLEGLCHDPFQRSTEEFISSFRGKSGKSKEIPQFGKHVAIFTRLEESETDKVRFEARSKGKWKGS